MNVSEIGEEAEVFAKTQNSNHYLEFTTREFLFYYNILFGLRTEGYWPLNTLGR